MNTLTLPGFQSAWSLLKSGALYRQTAEALIVVSHADDPDLQIGADDECYVAFYRDVEAANDGAPDREAWIDACDVAGWLSPYLPETRRSER